MAYQVVGTKGLPPAKVFGRWLDLIVAGGDQNHLAAGRHFGAVAASPASGGPGGVGDFVPMPIKVAANHHAPIVQIPAEGRGHLSRTDKSDSHDGPPQRWE